MQEQSPTSVQAIIPVAIINSLLAVAATLFFLVIGSMQFPRWGELIGSFAVAGFCAASAALFYQCLKCALNKPAVFSRRVIFFSAGLHQLIAFTVALAWGIYLLFLNTHDPRDWHGDEVDLSGVAAVCFTLAIWPAYGMFLFIRSYFKSRFA